MSFESIPYSVPMIEHVTDAGQILALIVNHNFDQPGIHFLTPPELSQQLAYMHHPAGKVISPHIHNSVAREVEYTQEVLIIKKGKLRVDFYSQQQQYLQSRVLGAGDVLLLIKGGHGFEMLSEVEMFEVKQGPYLGEQDKTQFVGSKPHQASTAENIEFRHRQLSSVLNR